MKEGWIGDDYLILFDESEVTTVTDRYALSQLLPSCQALGLRANAAVWRIYRFAYTFLCPL